MDNTPMTITLKDGLTSKYFGETYDNYDPSEISKANRTTNQYKVVFTCTQKAKGALIKALEADRNILRL